MLPVRACLVALGLALSGCAAAPNPLPADLVIWGGPIHTGDPAAPEVEAAAVQGGRFVAVGARRQVEGLVGPQTEVVDLRGAAAFPGFTDAHAHLRGVGERELTLNLEGTQSVAELVQRVAQAAQALPPGATLSGRGWIETGWPEGRMPTAKDLDAAAPDRPVALVRADGHALVANTAALAKAGITTASADPEGGRIERDASGAPTGLLIDNAMDLVAGLLPASSEAERRRALEKGLEVYAAYGWTGLHNMSVPAEDVTLLEALAAAEPLPLRVYNAVTPESAQTLFTEGARTTPDGRVITRAIKAYSDGALGSRGAALFAPYADAPHTSGLLLMREDEAARLYDFAIGKDLQMAVHAIGDRGNALTLEGFEQAFARAGVDGKALRWRVEHAQVVRPADIPRFAANGVIASMQPSHAIGDLHFAPARLGDDRLDGAYAWKSLLAAGAALAGGSDAPVERGSPLIEFYAAAFRKDLTGFAGPDWRPEEALSRMEALALFTSGPAFASFREDELGRIAVGYRADVSVFDVDLMQAAPEQILEGQALLTLIDGRTAYRRRGW